MKDEIGDSGIWRKNKKVKNSSTMKMQHRKERRGQRGNLSNKSISIKKVLHFMEKY